MSDALQPNPIAPVLEYDPRDVESFDWRRAMLRGGVVFGIIGLANLAVRVLTYPAILEFSPMWSGLRIAGWVATIVAFTAMLRGHLRVRTAALILGGAFAVLQLRQTMSIIEMAFPIRPNDGRRVGAFLVMVTTDAGVQFFWPLACVLLLLRRTRVHRDHLLGTAILYGGLLTILEGCAIVHEWLSYHHWPGVGRLPRVEQICDELAGPIIVISFTLAVKRVIEPAWAAAIATVAVLAPMVTVLMQIMQFNGDGKLVGAFYRSAESATYYFIIFFLAWTFWRVPAVRRR